MEAGKFLHLASECHFQVNKVRSLCSRYQIFSLQEISYFAVRTL